MGKDIYPKKVCKEPISTFGRVLMTPTNFFCTKSNMIMSCFGKILPHYVSPHSYSILLLEGKSFFLSWSAGGEEWRRDVFSLRIEVLCEISSSVWTSDRSRAWKMISDWIVYAFWFWMMLSYTNISLSYGKCSTVENRILKTMY